MRAMKISRFIFVSCLFAVFGMANEEGFSRYQLIIDRQPFGKELPEMSSRDVPPSESFARDMRLSMIFQGPDGAVRAGIVDNSTGKNYILRLNEPQNGLVMVEADIQTSEAMIRKGQEVALFKLHSGGGEVSYGEQPQESNESKSDSSSARRRRLQEARKRRESQKPPEPVLTGEALKKHLEQVQMDAIRNGLPPLPMQLTPEMDAQLVSEGVLPPQN